MKSTCSKLFNSMSLWRRSLAGGWLVASILCTASISAQEAISPPAAEEPAKFKPYDLPRPVAIEATGVPQVTEELQSQLALLKAYQNTRAAGFAGWDPGGEGMLIRTRFGNSVQLHRVYEPGGRREQVTFFDEPVSGMFLPNQSAGKLILSMDQGGNENDQIYVMTPESPLPTMITDGKSRNQLGAVRRDGSRLIFGSNVRNGRDTDLYLINPLQPASVKMVMQVENEFWSAVDWAPEGDQLLLIKYVSANESYPAILDIESGEKTMLPIPVEGIAHVGPIAFSHDGKSVIMATDAGGEFSQLQSLDLATKKFQPLTADIDWDVEELAIDPETGAMGVTVNNDGRTQMLLFTPGADGKFVRQEVEIPLGIASSLEFSPDGKSIGFTLVASDSPADAYSIEVASGKLTRWTTSEVGGLDQHKFVKPLAIRVKSFDGLEVPAWYYRPTVASGSHPVPVLIMIHGGPESQSQPYFSPIIQYYLDQLGIAVILPNVRGSSGYGKTYLKLDNAEKREDSVKDIGAILDWIAERDELDSKHVGVSGGSYGGYMVLASLVMYGDRLKCGIDNVGIANFQTFLENTAEYRRDLRRVEYGDERDPKMQEVFARISPALHADKIQSQLLVAHGVNDPRVPYSEAQQIAEKVRSGGKSVWTVYAANEGHGFAKKENADYLKAVEVMFLKASLLEAK